MSTAVRDFNAEQQNAIRFLRAYLNVKARLINTNSIVKVALEIDPRDKKFLFTMADLENEYTRTTKYEDAIGEDRTTFERIEYYKLHRELERGGVFDGRELFDLIGRGSYFAELLVTAFPSVVDEGANPLLSFRIHSRIPLFPPVFADCFAKYHMHVLFSGIAAGILLVVYTNIFHQTLLPLAILFSIFFLFPVPLIIHLQISAFEVRKLDPAWQSFDKKRARRAFSGAFGFGRQIMTTAHAIDRLQTYIMELEQYATEYEKPEMVADVHGRARFAGAADAAQFAGGGR